MSEIIDFDLGAQVYELRKDSVPFTEIAAQFGIEYMDAVMACRRYEAQLAASFPADNRQAAVMMELDRLDDLQRKTARYLDDPSPQNALNAVDKIIKIMAHRMKLMGLDQLNPADAGTQTNILVVGKSTEEFLEALRHGQKGPVVASGERDDEDDEGELEVTQ